MEVKNCNNPTQKPNHYQIGDWVYERGITGVLSPAMYIVSMLKDTLYLEIDPEQGDPFEVDLEDIEPIPLTKEWLQSQGVYGKRIVNTYDAIETIPGIITKWELNDWVDIHKYKDRFIAKFHGVDNEYLHVVYLRYVHDLQHFLPNVRNQQGSGFMICDACHGSGYVDNPQYDRYSNVVAYENGIPSRIRCKRCGGDGYFVGNVKEAIDMLKASIANRKGLSVKESKQLLRILNNYNNGTK